MVNSTLSKKEQVARSYNHSTSFHVQLPKRDKTESQPLHFIALTGSAIYGKHDPEQRRTIRSAVMKDYLRQSTEPQQPKGAAVKDDIRNHIGRFRSSQKRKVRHGTIADVHQPSSRTFRRLKPIERDKSITDSSALITAGSIESLPMTLPIESPNSETMDLLEYYHVSFWENSFAGNPEGIWLSITLSDAALFHANMCLVAQHRRASRNSFNSSIYYWHRGEAMRIIGNRLDSQDEATSDATIAAVAILSNADNHGLWTEDVQQSHIDGLTQLVSLRGGLDKMSVSNQIKRVIGWADLLHAIAHSRHPRLTFGECRKDADRLVLDPHSDISDPDVLDVPLIIREILQNLRTLTMTKSRLLLARDKEVCKTFSSLLYATERFSLYVREEDIWNTNGLQEGHQESTSIWNVSATVEAFKAAVVLCTLHDLRDLPPQSAFFDNPVNRLVSSLGQLMNDPNLFGSRYESRGTSESGLAVLLWMLLQLWKTTEHRPHERFLACLWTQQLCSSQNVANLDDFRRLLKMVVYSDEHCPRSTMSLWTEVHIVTP